VLASAGYPASSHSGDVIEGTEAAEQAGCAVVHAGTARSADGALVTAGGRVLAVVGTGDDLASARAAAYRGVDAITFDGMQHRTDIASAAAGSVATA
jgi:phosphoribosylamine--glycine ligase